MKFCPKCDVRLKKGADGLECPKCGHVDHDAPPAPEPAQSLSSQSTFKVLDEPDAPGTESTIEKECDKCGNGEAVWWMLQTRSADEPTTQFYRCTKCGYTWRDYS